MGALVAFLADDFVLFVFRRPRRLSSYRRLEQFPLDYFRL
jgi:hypothetical protein